MTPTVSLVHSIPGRVRFRINQGSLPNSNLARVSALPGIRKLATNTLTGSVLVHLSGAVDIEGLRHNLEAELAPAPSPLRTTGRSPGTVLANQVRSLPSLLLIAGAGLAVLSGGLADAGIMGSVWLVNNLLGLASEWKSEKQLRLGLAPTLTYRVRRGKHNLVLSPGQLRVGDHVFLEPGHVLPADGDIIQDDGLCVDESVLTGEACPHEKPSVVWQGTTVVAGQAILQVRASSEASRVGRLEREVVKQTRLPDALHREFAHLTKILCLCSGLLGGGLISVGLASGLSRAEVINTAISLAISTIPEGLSSVALASLAMGVSRLHKQGVLVRRLGALPGLGLADAVCLDKTGTLTQNLLTLQTPAPQELLEMAKLAARPSLARHPLDQAIHEAWLSQEGRIHQQPSVHGREAIKGTPEIVLPLCNLDPERREALVRSATEMSGRGLRVVAVAIRQKPDPVWTWLGLLGFADPPRATTAATLAGLAQLELPTLLLTGDHPETARAVVEQFQEGRPTVLARLSPEGKRAAVRQLQQEGRVVVMVGDGFNDCPALSIADVAVALTHGVEVSKNLADVVLPSERLDHLVLAIREGRAVMGDIRRGLRYLLSACFADLLLVAGCLLLRVPFPMSGRQLLWMNLVSDLGPALALVNESQGTESQTAARPARRLIDSSAARTIGRDALTLAGGTAASYAWALSRYGAGARANTLAFTTITMSEILYALACRSSRRSQGLPKALLLAGSAQIATVLVPLLRGLLGTSPLGWLDWGVVAAASLASLGISSRRPFLNSQTRG